MIGKIKDCVSSLSLSSSLIIGNRQRNKNTTKLYFSSFLTSSLSTTIVLSRSSSLGKDWEGRISRNDRLINASEQVISEGINKSGLSRIIP
jgi:hypothetical protein